MAKYTNVKLKDINISVIVLELRGLIKKDDRNIYRLVL